MNQLFERDTMQTRTILSMVVDYLWLSDLHELKLVTSLSRQLVGNYRHLELVTLCEPHRLTLDQYRHRGGIRVEEGTIASAYPAGRPFLTNVCINTLIEPRNPHPNWDWMLATLTRRETRQDVSRLALHIVSSVDRLGPGNFSYCDSLNSRAEAALQNLTFTRCTRLSMYICDTHRFVMPTLLKHFPFLEHLSLQGGYLPLISCLPAPEKLRSIDLNIYVPFYASWSHTTRDVTPQVINLSGLKMLQLNFRPTFNPQDRLVTHENEATALMSRTTGVLWLASLIQYPPTNLEHLNFQSLSKWSVPLLALCYRLSPVCRSLNLQMLHDKAIIGNLRQDLLINGGKGGKLKQLKKFAVFHIQEAPALVDLLKLTPSLEELEIGLLDSSRDEEEGLKRSILSLRSLKKIQNDGTYMRNKPDWVRSLQQEAASGLAIDYIACHGDSD